MSVQAAVLTRRPAQAVGVTMQFAGPVQNIEIVELEPVNPSLQQAI